MTANERRRWIRLMVLFALLGGGLLGCNYLWRPFDPAFWFGVALIGISVVGTVVVRRWPSPAPMLEPLDPE